MQIQVRHGSDVEANGAFADHVAKVVGDALGRFEHRLTRVEVHLADENGPKKSKDDMRCTIEARLEGRDPSAVTHHAATREQAVSGAVHKMERLLDSTIGKLQEHR